MYIAVEEAKRLLEKSDSKVTGIKDERWKNHSIIVAQCAEKIAAASEDMDVQKAYSLGLLHDIGRQYGKCGIKHIIKGYDMLSSMGADENAKVCLTHSFPHKDGRAFSGIDDLDAQENDFIQKYIKNTEYDDYDYLIQLCDEAAMPYGPVFLEKRMIEKMIRNGFNNYTINRCRKYLELKEYFDEKCGCDIYNLIL